MSAIKLPQLAWYGIKELELPLPDNWSVKFYNMAGFDRPAMKPEAMKAAIANPIGSPPIRELARVKNEVVIIFDDMTRATRTHYLTPKTSGEEILIANTFVKANEALMIGLHVPFAATNGREMDIVLIANAPDGQSVHYLLGNFGKTFASEQKLVTKIPPHINHLIIYSEYPDLAGLGYIEKSGKVIYVNRWDDVLRILRQYHPSDANVAVYPNAEIQYCA